MGIMIGTSLQRRNMLELGFAFWCELCPGDYRLTVASHDPDGVWHDWLEDAVAFSVSDSRYTAGVANLQRPGKSAGAELAGLAGSGWSVISNPE
jgi:hypothetical protein